MYRRAALVLKLLVPQRDGTYEVSLRYATVIMYIGTQLESFTFRSNNEVIEFPSGGSGIENTQLIFNPQLVHCIKLINNVSNKI